MHMGLEYIMQPSGARPLFQGHVQFTANAMHEGVPEASKPSFRQSHPGPACHCHPEPQPPSIYFALFIGVFLSVTPGADSCPYCHADLTGKDKAEKKAA